VVVVVREVLVLAVDQDVMRSLMERVFSGNKSDASVGDGDGDGDGDDDEADDDDNVDSERIW